ncbi:MAG TPA: phosphoribosyltransferase family protein, partial [Verrucomicrobiae bacterium]|nr:phosphoribosyltransferase family protein [Verrucomicrobiae bacterium]
HQELNRVLSRKKRHIRFESGFHTDQWLDLESLFVHPEKLDPFADKLSAELSTLSLDAVCGALTGGAFLAELLARRLGLEFYYSQRTHVADTTGLYTAIYKLPKSQQQAVSGKRIVVIDDVVSAGSATRGTFSELMSCGARPVAAAALLVQGQSVPTFCAEQSLQLSAIDFEEINMWTPEDCPFCKAGDKPKPNE